MLARWVVLIVCLATFPSLTYARDGGQWGDQADAIREWYRTLKQPDYPTASCCGEADAYYCDIVRVDKGQTYCKITDERDDGPLQRPHREIGTEFLIPNNKLKWDAGNPTGHAVVFLTYSGFVLCFVQGSGT